MVRRILITGGTGLVGHGLQSVIEKHAGVYLGEEIELVCVGSADADLRDAEAVRRMLKKHAPLDGIIHCAANVGGLFKNMREPVSMLEDNLLMNTHVLREAHSAGIDNVVCILSTCIFPDALAALGVEMTSAMLHNGPPHPSNEGYAYAKRMMEVQCRAYQRQYGRRYFCVVPTNIYGPHDNFDLENAHVIPALIHKAYNATRDETEFMVAGDGSPLRQFIYVDDLARLILNAYITYPNDMLATPKILCPPKSETTIGHVAMSIAEYYGIADKVVFDISKANGQSRKTVVPTPKEGVDDLDYMPIEDGLKLAVDWFFENNRD